MSASMRSILIIGGTSGIGEAFAKRFHQMGKKVIVTGRRQQKLAELKQSLNGLETYAFDMTDTASVPGHVEALFSKYPAIDTVWVNGGRQYASDIKDFASTTDAKISEEVLLNVTAPMILAHHIVPRLAQQKTETNFMITSSGLGFVPFGSLFPVYCATKAAVHSYCVGVRQALKATNVNVLELVPPYVGGTELGMEHIDKIKGLKPLAMEDFVEEIFGKLEGSAAKDLKELAAGSAAGWVEAWRSGTGAVLESSGLGG
ncbi:hypothetical protein LTR09_003253 [Extremus antarcticus]|uniref:Uncharacterized protein n=1 Tax=Extremus antarcticus TaxID=702011 RepID=A0AAJ0GEL0_9PEZI|nr:hypothetical protein LTR09_003253 [Extremus antarcticus]